MLRINKNLLLVFNTVKPRDVISTSFEFFRANNNLEKPFVNRKR
jgi:hypothetical protein